MTAADRVERIIKGVVQQAVRAARAGGLRVSGDGADARLLRSWFAETDAGQALTLHPMSKTGLLLARAPCADVFPFGDLYFGEVVQLAGSAELPEAVLELAAGCGGIEALDDALRGYFDQRLSWDAAAAHLPASAGCQLKGCIDAARFHRLHAKLVPKLGARTLGIDLQA